MNGKKTELSEQQKTLLGHLARDMGYYGEWCFYMSPDQDIKTYGGYIPAMVFRDVENYFTMKGPLYSDIPFIIGQNLDEARLRCKLMNQYIKLNDETVNEILESAQFYIA